MRYCCFMVSCFLSTCPHSHYRLRDAVREKWSHLVSERSPIWAVLVDDRPAIVAPTAEHLAVVSGEGLRKAEDIIRFDEVTEVSVAQSVVHLADDQGRRHAFTFLDTSDAATAAQLIADRRFGAPGGFAALPDDPLTDVDAAGAGVPPSVAEPDHVGQADAEPVGEPVGGFAEEPAAEFVGEPAGEFTDAPVGEPAGRVAGEFAGPDEPAGEPVEEFAAEFGEEAREETAGEFAGEPAAEFAGVPAAEFAGVPAGEFAGELAEEFAGEPAGEFAGEPAGEFVGEPAGEFVGEPAGEFAKELAGEPAEFAGEPAVEFVEAPAGEFAGEPVGEFAGEPVGEFAEELAGESADLRGLDPSAETRQETALPQEPVTAPTPSPPAEPSAGLLDADLAEFATRDLVAIAELPLEREVAWLLARSGGAPLGPPPEREPDPTAAAEIVIPAQGLAAEGETVLLATTEQIPGRVVDTVHGEVLGLAAPTASGTRDVHDLARQRLAQAALRRGANAVVGMRYWASVLVPGEVAAYGTAVTLAPVNTASSTAAR